MTTRRTVRAATLTPPPSNSRDDTQPYRRRMHPCLGCGQVPADEVFIEHDGSYVCLTCAGHGLPPDREPVQGHPQCRVV